MSIITKIRNRIFDRRFNRMIDKAASGARKTLRESKDPRRINYAKEMLEEIDKIRSMN